jgi:uncharacterized protein YerC
MKKQPKECQLADVVAELDAIKRLQILTLMKSGVTQDTIANALGVGQATISRMFPKGIGGRKG